MWIICNDSTTTSLRQWQCQPWGFKGNMTAMWVASFFLMKGTNSTTNHVFTFTENPLVLNQCFGRTHLYKQFIVYFMCFFMILYMFILWVFVIFSVFNVIIYLIFIMNRRWFLDESRWSSVFSWATPVDWCCRWPAGNSEEPASAAMSACDHLSSRKKSVKQHF